MMRRNILAALITAVIGTRAFAQATLPADAPLPAGHPAIPSMLANDLPATQPGAAAATGTLTVKLVPGSAGMALSAEDVVTVELFHRNAKIKQYELHADKDFTVTLKDVPVMPPVQAVVSVKHNGLLQQTLTPELSPDAPSQSVQMKVFEPTDTPPAWKVAMQHMILQWDAEKHGLQVTEMISTASEGDKAWLGAKAGTEEGAKGRVTLTIPLPPGVEEVDLGDGFTQEGCRIADGKLVTGDPLFPGRTEYRFSYLLPIGKAEAHLPIASPAAADNLIVFAPADGALIKAEGLSGGDVVDSGSGQVRMYRAENLAAGATVNLELSNINIPSAAGIAPAAGGAPNARPEISNGPREVALGGAFLMVLVGGAMLLMKKPQVKKA